MDKTISIILELINNATPALEAAAAEMQGALEGMQTAVGNSLGGVSDTVENMKSNVSDAMGAMAGSTESAATSTETMGSRFRGAMNDIGGVVSNIGGKIGSVFTGMGEHGAWASVFMGAAALKLGSDFISLASSTELARIRFNTLTGSVKEGGALLEWLTQFSLMVPVTRQHLQDMATSLLGYGYSVNDAKQALQGLTNAMAATGMSQQHLNAVTLNLGEIYNATTPTIRNFNQLSRDGVQTNKLLAMAVQDHLIKIGDLGTATGGAASSTSKYAQEVVNAAEKQKLLTDRMAVTNERLSEYTAKHNGASDAHTKSANTLDHLNRSLSINQQAMTIVQDRVTTTTEQMKQQEVSVARLNDQHATLSQRIADTTSKMATLSSTHQASKATLDSYKVTLESEQFQMEKNSEAAAKAKSKLGELGSAVGDAKNSLSKLTEEQVKSALKMNTGAELAKALAVEMNKLYSGAAVKNSMTVAGAWTTIKDGIQLAAQSILGVNAKGELIKTGLFFQLEQVMDKLVKFIQTHRDEIVSFFSNMGKVLGTLPGMLAILAAAFGLILPALIGIVGPALLSAAAMGLLGVIAGKIIQHFGGLTAVMKDLVGAWNKVHAALEPVGRAFDAVMKALQPVFNFLGQHAKVILAGLAGAVIMVTGAMIFFYASTIIGWVTASAAAVIGAAAMVIATLSVLWPWLLLGAAIGIIVYEIVTHWKNIQQVAGVVGKAIGGFFSQLGKDVQNFISFVKSHFEQILMFVGPAGWLVVGIVEVVKHWGQIIGTAKNLWSGFVNFLKAIPDAIVGFFTALPGRIGKIAMDMALSFVYGIGFLMGASYALITQGIPKFVNAIIQWGADMIKEVATWPGRFMTWIQKTITDVITAITSWGSNMKKKTVETGTNVINEIATWPGRVMSWITNLVTTVLTTIQNFAHSFDMFIFNLGVSTIKEISTWPERIMKWIDQIPKMVGDALTALHNAFTSKLNAIKNTIAGWVNDVIGAFQKVLDIIGKVMGALGGALSSGFKAGSALHFADGGVVPGPIGAPVPIIAHAGERVIPTSGMDTGGSFKGSGGQSISINFNGGVTLDSDQRVKDLARRIGNILGRQNELARYGAGY